MKLNLSIFAEDLSKYQPRTHISTDKLKFHLEFATIYAPKTQLQSNALYLITAEHLADIPLSQLTDKPSFVCVGKPTDTYLNAQVCNAIWVDEGISLFDLHREISQFFILYEKWITSLNIAIINNRSLRTLGELSSKIFRKPLWTWDNNYHTLFSVVDTRHYRIPEGYTKHEDSTPWPLWELNAWIDGGYIDAKEITTYKEPYILPATNLFNYRALAINVFVEKAYAATITVEEIDSEITDRDHALLVYFGEALGRALKKEQAINLSAGDEVDKVIARLLDGQFVAPAELTYTFKGVAWDIHDPIAIVVAEPRNALYTDKMLALTAAKTSEKLKGVIYAVDKHDIVFILNMRLISLSLPKMIDEIHERLIERNYQTKLGIGTIFDDISYLRYFRMQASNAIRIGEAHPQSDSLTSYRFEDYILEFAVKECMKESPPRTLFPQGFTDLYNYDMKNNSNLLNVLKAYLENNMQATETARQLFMHRNTLNKKLKKIQSMLKLDLDDPDTRLLLLLDFKMIE